MLPWLMSCVVSTPSVAIVTIGDFDAATMDRARLSHPHALTAAEVSRRLTGTDAPRAPNEDSLEQMLRDARDREARFDSVGASDLRVEIARAFAESVRPSSRVRHIAAQSAHDQAAALLAGGDREEALRVAKQTAQSFPTAPLDPDRYPPPVLGLFARAEEQLAASPAARLRVEVDTPGTVIVEGFELGRTDTAVEHELPTGSYRVWWADDQGNMSLPHRVELGSAGATVRIPAQHEQHVRVHPSVALRCSEDCAERLQVLGRQLGVTTIVGVRHDAEGLSVDVESGDVEIWPDPAGARPRSSFSPWYLAPLGVGQIAQERYVLGASYATVQLGLLGWHMVAWKRHADAVGASDFGREPELRSQRNLSAALFWGALAAGVAEALLVGWLTGE